MFKYCNKKLNNSKQIICYENKIQFQDHFYPDGRDRHRSAYFILLQKRR